MKIIYLPQLENLKKKADSVDKINLINTKSYEEIYIAMNNVRYRHIYYIAKCHENDFNNISNLFNPKIKLKLKKLLMLNGWIIIKF